MIIETRLQDMFGISMDRAEIVHENFATRVKEQDLPMGNTSLSDAGMSGEFLLDW